MSEIEETEKDEKPEEDRSVLDQMAVTLQEDEEAENDAITHAVGLGGEEGEADEDEGDGDTPET